MSEAIWYCVLGRQQAGPFDLEAMASMIRLGQLHSHDFVWCEGMPQWQAAASVEQLRALFLSAPTHPAPPAPAAMMPPPLQYYGQPYYAGFWLRFAAAVIDGMLLLVGGCIIGGCVGGVAGAAGGMRAAPAGTHFDVVIQLATQLSGVLIGWLYHALMESGPWQATLGKKALGLVVTDLQGGRITFGRATGRHFAKIISGIILMIGYMMAGWTEKKQALHDMIAGTLVIRPQV